MVEQVGILRSFSNAGTIAAGADYAPLNDAIGRVLQEQPFLNFIDVLNKDSTTVVAIRLNGDANKQIPVDTSGGRVVIQPKDGIKFSDVLIRNLHASSATGANSLRVTVGRLEE